MEAVLQPQDPLYCHLVPTHSLATRVAGMRPSLRGNTVICRQPRARLCPLLFTSHQAPAKSSALSFSCPKYFILARCCLFPLWAGLAVSLCSVECSLFLRSLCWSASPGGGGQRRQQWAASPAEWGSLPQTAPSSCPSATAPRLCTSYSGYIPLGHWGRVQESLLCCKKHFQEQQEPSVMGGRYGLWGDGNANGLKKVLVWYHLSTGFCTGSLLSCTTPDALQSMRFWCIQHFLGD